MGLLTLAVSVFGTFLVGLVALATMVAVWELLCQRELLDRTRRDRAAFAATSPLPLAAGAPMVDAAFARQARASPTGADGSDVAGAAAAGTRRDPNWIETRPMILSQVPAIDDETRPRKRELDLALD